MGVLSAHHPRCEAHHPSDAIEHVYVELKLSLHVLAQCHCQTFKTRNNLKLEVLKGKVLKAVLKLFFRQRFSCHLQSDTPESPPSHLPLARCH